MNGEFFVHGSDLGNFLGVVIFRSLLLLENQAELLSDLQAPLEQVSEFLLSKNLQILTTLSDLICGVLKTVQGRHSKITTNRLLEAKLVVGTQNGDGIRSVDEFGNRDFLELSVITLLITLTLTLLLLGVEDLGFVVRCRG